MIDRLANVVEEAGAFGRGRIKIEFGAISPIKWATFDGMIEDVLRETIRKRSRPSSLMISTCNDGRPTFITASSPARKMDSSISSETLATTSSMRVG
jgi:hypothetical protein